MRRGASFFAAVVTALGLMAASASAATYNIVGSFSGGPLGTVNFDVTIDADFSSNISFTTAGLTVNSLTSTEVLGDPFISLGYGYTQSTDTLAICGFSFGCGTGSAFDDFALYFSDFQTAPIYAGGAESIARDPTSVNVFVSNLTVTVTEVTPVPLPAGGVLLLTGILAAAGLGYRKKRAA